MDIEPDDIKIGDLVKGYTDNGMDNDEAEVMAYSGNLEIRPKYQRQFVYGEKNMRMVIDSILNNFPLNVMYWVDREDDTYEVLDGQQRIISICEFVADNFSIKAKGEDHPLSFKLLDKKDQNRILKYPLKVYKCKGSDKEVMDWFKIVNIAGKVLTSQEIRNAIYHGKFVEDAKRKFSRTNCGAKVIEQDKYLKGNSLRQDWMEIAIKWKCRGDISEYMRINRENNAEEVWQHFKNVTDWIDKTFPKYRTDMKLVDWGMLYADYKDKNIDIDEVNAEVEKLRKNKENKKSGIYPYVITRNESYLNRRGFDDDDKRMAYETQDGKCNICEKECEIEEMHADHIMPWSKGGKTIPENCQMLCAECNLVKSDK